MMNSKNVRKDAGVSMVDSRKLSETELDCARCESADFITR